MKRPILHVNPLPTPRQLAHTLRWQCAYRQTQGVSQDAIIEGLILSLSNHADADILAEALRLYAVECNIPPEPLP